MSDEQNVVTVLDIMRAIGEFQREKVERFLKREGIEPVNKIGPTRVWDRSIIDRCREALCPDDHVTDSAGGGS